MTSLLPPVLFSWVGDELDHPLPTMNFKSWFSLKSLLLCLLHRSLWQWQQQSPWQGTRMWQALEDWAGERTLSAGKGKRQVLSHCYYKFLAQLENQTDGALNIDRVFMMALVMVQLLTEGMKLVKNLNSFWHFPLPKTLCKVIAAPTVKAWTLELLSVHHSCQLNSQIIAFKNVQRIVAKH